MSTNEERAARGKHILNTYCQHIMGEGGAYPEDDPDTLTDLLTDLLHATGAEFYTALDTARSHYIREAME